MTTTQKLFDVEVLVAPGRKERKPRLHRFVVLAKDESDAIAKVKAEWEILLKGTWKAEPRLAGIVYRGAVT